MAPRKTKHPAIQAIEARHGQPMHVLLRDLYVEQRLSELQIANRLHLSVATVHKWLVRSDIPRRQFGYPPSP